MNTHKTWSLLVGAALVFAVGCLVVAPLDDLPAKKAVTAAGGRSGDAGSGQAGVEPGALGGEGGHPPAAGGDASGTCTTNAECAQQAADEPYRCRPSDHQCVALRSDECPIVVGPASDANAVYFGAFATLNGATLEDNPIVWAHELALNELGGDNVGGLPDGPGGKRRPMVMIVCNNTDGMVEPAMKHLAEDAQVPAVIGTLKPGDLRRAYDAYLERDIFYLSPVSVTTPVTALNSRHIWNLLGQPSDFAPTYVALLKRSEAWLRQARGLAEGTQLKVVLVTTGDAFDSELRDSLLGVLEFNGKSLTDNGDDHFQSIELKGDAKDLAANALAIAQFAPDIVISAASEPFVMNNGLEQQIEDEWGVNAGAQPRPFYILSPYNAGDVTDLMTRISGRLEGDVTAGEDQQRFVGVSIASAVDKTLQNAYAIRLRSLFKDAIVDTANYYDAVYYLAYAMYGANQPDGLTGSGIVQGMQRLLSGKSVNVGPGAAISATFKALAVAGSTVHLESTLGPPDFDPNTGVRPVNGSVFCFKRISTTVKLVSDVLRYDDASKGFSGSFSPCNSEF